MIYVLYLAPIVVVCIFPRLMVSYFVSFRDCQISFLILFFFIISTLCHIDIDFFRFHQLDFFEVTYSLRR